MKQEFGTHPGYEKEIANAVIDQLTGMNHAVAVGKNRLPTMTTSRLQNEPHVEYNNWM